MPLYLWSQTSGTNASADSTINWAEGQSPSSINDSARAMMAAVAKYRDDLAGSIVTSGTSTAYTVTTNSGFDTLAHLNGQVVAFAPHTTNAATVTLNVDSLGAKPLRTSPSVELQSGVLIQGTPYAAVYNSSDGAFYLFGVGAAPGVPLLAGMDYWDTTTPSSAFIFPAGQAISRTTYATAFAKWGTTYGAGDGTTTFNVPDKTGRISAMKESSASRLTSSYFGGNSTAMGATGGAEDTTLTLAQLPTGITSANAAQSITVAAGGQSIPVSTNPFSGGNSTSGGNPTPISVGGGIGQTTSLTGSNSISVTSNNTSGNPHRTVQPTIITNYIIRII